MIKTMLFILMFIFANLKFLDVLYGMTNLDLLATMCVYAIVYALIITIWLPFPHRSSYDT